MPVRCISRIAGLSPEVIDDSSTGEIAGLRTFRSGGKLPQKIRGVFEDILKKRSLFVSALTAQIEDQHGKKLLLEKFEAETKPLILNLIKRGTRFIGEPVNIVKAMNKASLESLMRSLRRFESGFSGEIEIRPFNEVNSYQVIPRHVSVFAIQKAVAESRVGFEYILENNKDD